MRRALISLVLVGCRFGFDDVSRSGLAGDDGPGGSNGSDTDGGIGDEDGMVDAVMLPRTVTLATGGAHTCALTAAGNVRCWGDGQYGQLGYANTGRIGDNEHPATAGDVTVGGTVVQIVAGEAHTCVLLDTGKVRCWGDSMYGQLGYGNMTAIGDDETPATAGDVDVGELVVQIAAGTAYTCAVTITGGVRCWGDGQYGQLGYGGTATIGDNETPASKGDVPLGASAIAVACGTAHTCAIVAGDKVRCWGDAMYGQLGYGNTTNINDASLAGDVPLGLGATALAADEVHTCAITTTGSVRCWGDSMFGQLGYGNTTRRGDNEPASMAGDVPFGTGKAVEIDAGFVHTCIRLDTGAARCWGDGFYGALGYGNTTVIGDTEPASTPGTVPVGGTIVELSTGTDHTCARMMTGAVRCWGEGALGRLGYNSTTRIGDSEPASTGGDVMY